MTKVNILSTQLNSTKQWEFYKIITFAREHTDRHIGGTYDFIVDIPHEWTATNKRRARARGKEKEEEERERRVIVTTVNVSGVVWSTVCVCVCVVCGAEVWKNKQNMMLKARCGFDYM